MRCVQSDVRVGSRRKDILTREGGKCNIGAGGVCAHASGRCEGWIIEGVDALRGGRCLSREKKGLG